MVFEGILKYFWMLFFVYLIILLVVKISLSSVLKKAGIKPWKLFIPIYCRYIIIKKLEMKKSVFFMTLIPIVNLYFYNIIIGRMLETFEQDSSESVMFIVLPLYKFPELAFKNPEFTFHLYDATEEFIHNEKSLFEKEENVSEITDTNNEVIIKPSLYNQTGNVETVFSNNNLEPDERQETFIEAKKEEEKTLVNPVTVNNLKPKSCPNCGTKLESTAKVCFFCGTSV